MNVNANANVNAYGYDLSVEDYGAMQVGRVIHEWDEPSHPEHAENGWSLWRMHNAVTEALKVPVDDNGMPTRAAAPMAMDRTIGLTKLLDEVARFDPRQLN